MKFIAKEPYCQIMVANNDYTIDNYSVASTQKMAEKIVERLLKQKKYVSAYYRLIQEFMPEKK